MCLSSHVYPHFREWKMLHPLRPRASNSEKRSINPQADKHPCLVTEITDSNSFPDVSCPSRRPSPPCLGLREVLSYLCGSKLYEVSDFRFQFRIANLRCISCPKQRREARTSTQPESGLITTASWDLANRLRSLTDPFRDPPCREMGAFLIPTYGAVTKSF